MSRKEKLWQILKAEYGITNVAELDEAIRSQAKLDITAFVKKPGKRDAINDIQYESCS